MKAPQYRHLVHEDDDEYAFNNTVRSGNGFLRLNTLILVPELGS